MPTTDHMNVREILDAYKSESIDLELAESKIRKSFYSDLGHTLLDLDREARTGSGEVIFGSGKTASQIDDIIADASKRGAAWIEISTRNYPSYQRDHLITSRPNFSRRIPTSQSRWKPK